MYSITGEKNGSIVFATSPSKALRMFNDAYPEEIVWYINKRHYY